MKVTLPKKPFEGATMHVEVPSGYSWRLKVACLLFRLAAWVLGGRISFHFDRELEASK